MKPWASAALALVPVLGLGGCAPEPLRGAADIGLERVCVPLSRPDSGPESYLISVGAVQLEAGQRLDRIWLDSFQMETHVSVAGLPQGSVIAEDGSATAMPYSLRPGDNPDLVGPGEWPIVIRISATPARPVDLETTGYGFSVGQIDYVIDGDQRITPTAFLVELGQCDSDDDEFGDPDA